MILDHVDQVSPLSSPTERDWAILWKLYERLHELGYTEQGASQAMGMVDHCMRDFRAWPVHARNCRRQREENPCALLAAFFLIEESVDRQELEGLLGAEAVKLLHSLKWIGMHDNGRLYFRYYLYPLLGAFILTDGAISTRNNVNHVYHLMSDSHLLARLAPRPKAALSLDHCTGSGVHAVLAGPHSERGFGLDINPRALQFSRFNAKWNGQRNVSFLESDCYENVRPEVLQLEAPCHFDLITANPPFVPTPDTLSLCRGGGFSGEEVTEKIVSGLPHMLSPDGIFSMITNIPVFRNQTFFERCEGWLDSSEGWGMLVLTNQVWSLQNYILAHQNPVSFEEYGSNFERWLGAYESVQLQWITGSQAYLFRSQHPWRVERTFGYPAESASRFIESWIASLRDYLPGSPAPYRIHPGVEKIWWLDDRSRAYVEWKQEYHWWQAQGIWLDGSAAETLAVFQAGGDGLDSAGLDPAGLTALLGEHLVTLA